MIWKWKSRLYPLSAAGKNRGKKEAEQEKALQEDFRRSLRVEKYRIGALAVYIPAGFSWRYLLREEIRQVRTGRRIISSENGVCPFSMEAPAIRLLHAGGEEILELENEKKAGKIEELLSACVKPGK